MALGLLCVMTKAVPAFSCSSDSPCAASVIDGFFLPLITTSLGNPNRVPPTPQPPASARRITIIPEMLPDEPPPEPSVPPVPPVTDPVQRLSVTRTLVAGTLPDGGEADMFFEILPIADPGRDAPPAQVTLPDLELMMVEGDPDMLLMTHLVVLPTGNSWPLQSLSQPVAMQITCGACGPDGAFLRFDGTGMFEMQIESRGGGWITDIDLRGTGGQVAHGEMHFMLHESDGNILTAELAELRLVIDQDRMDLATRLLLWRGARQVMEGVFVGMPTGDSLDKGAFTGQFSGAGCIPVCGVEN